MRFADFHCDTVLKLYTDNLDFAAESSLTHLDLLRMQRANVVFQCFAVFPDPAWGQEAMLRHTLRMINLAREQVFTRVKLATTGAQIDPAGEDTWGMISIEGADFIGDDLFLLDLVQTMGVRLITLTWNGRNSLADGVGLGEYAGGLTKIGRMALKHMQNLKIIADVSHLANKGFWDVVGSTTRPIVASHSNCKTLCAHPRNLDDQQIKAIAETEGIIGVNLAPHFIAEVQAEQTLAGLVRHIVHITETAGIDTVCLGLDLDGISHLPKGMTDVLSLTELPQELAAAGFTSAEIEAICYKNLMDFLAANME